MYEPDDLADLFTGPPAGPALPVTYRQGRLVSFNPITLENQVEVSGKRYTNIPLLGIGEASSLQPGDAVGILVMGRSWGIIGQFVRPNTPEAATAISLASSNVYTEAVGTGGTTSTGSFSDLATPGPALIDVRIGPSGRCIVDLASYVLLQIVSAAPASAHMGFVASGPTSVPADISRALALEGAEGTAIDATRGVLVEGLSPGLYSFAAKYSMTGGTAYFEGRVLTVTAL